MARRYDLIIVGMGSGGMVAAELAVALGLDVAVVERDRLGGDCLWTGCVPSKALLASAKVAHHMRDAAAYGIGAVEPEIDTARVLERVREIQRRIAATDDSPERFRELGVDLRIGQGGRLTGPHTVAVGGEQLEARRILLCTGSRPAVPGVDGLAEAGFQTSETVWDCERLPRTVVVIGGGPIAVELAQALRRLGSTVTLLEREDRILPRDEPELAGRLADRLREEGVELVLGAVTERVSVEGARKVVHGTVGGAAARWAADELLVAAGRAPNVEDLGLEALSIDVGPRGIEVDERRRTSLHSVYAVGDVAGRHLFTHAAAAEAAKAVRDMFLPGRGRLDAVVPWCTFTDPELAHAGLTAAEARASHGADAVEVHRLELAHSDRARAEGEDAGALLVVTAKRRIVGAHVLAPAAGELIGELTLAIERRLKVSDLGALVHVYPTFATAIAQLAGEDGFAKARRFRRLARQPFRRR